MSNARDMYIDDCMECPFHNYKGKKCGLEYDEDYLKEYPDQRVDMSHNLEYTRSKNCPLRESTMRVH